MVGLRADEVPQVAAEGEQVAEGLVGDLRGVGPLHVRQDNVALGQLRDFHQVFDPGFGCWTQAQFLAGRSARGDEAVARDRVADTRHGIILVPTLDQFSARGCFPELRELFRRSRGDEDLESFGRAGL